MHFEFLQRHSGVLHLPAELGPALQGQAPHCQHVKDHQVGQARQAKRRCKNGSESNSWQIVNFLTCKLLSSLDRQVSAKSSHSQGA